MRKPGGEKAVSPVIGVILMVAITVILAAVIAAFVFGMGEALKHTVKGCELSELSEGEYYIYEIGEDTTPTTYLVEDRDENEKYLVIADPCFKSFSVGDVVKKNASSGKWEKIPE